MKRYRWSIILAISNCLLAACLFILGQREFRSLARVPGAFYEGSAGYVPTAQKVSYCLNAPSLVASAPLRNWLMGHTTVNGLRVNYGDFEYGAAVFLFWWWVGTRIEAFRANRGLQRKPNSRFVASIGYVLGLLLSLVLLYGGVTGLLGKNTVGSPVLISMILWGLGLLYYLAARLREPSAGCPISRALFAREVGD